MHGLVSLNFKKVNPTPEIFFLLFPSEGEENIIKCSHNKQTKINSLHLYVVFLFRAQFPQYSCLT